MYVVIYNQKESVVDMDMYVNMVRKSKVTIVATPNGEKKANIRTCAVITTCKH